MTSPLDAELAAVEEAIREGDWGMFDAGTLAEGLEDRDGTVLELVYACAICDQPLPESFRREFACGTCGEPLGSCVRGTRRSDTPQQGRMPTARLVPAIPNAKFLIWWLRPRNRRDLVTDDLFEEVGRKVGLARETTKKLYAAAGGGRLAARVLSYSKK